MTGIQTHEVGGYGSVAFCGDTIVKTTDFMPPTPGNLQISRDGGKNRDDPGDPKYLYGMRVTVNDGIISYSEDNEALSLENGWRFITGIDTTTWDSSAEAPKELVLQVNLETGETVVMDN